MLVTMHGMNPPSQYRSADGSWFVSCNAPKGGRFQVFREFPDGHTEELAETRERIIGGQGMLCLQPDGTMWASYGETAGTSPVGRFQIKQWIAPQWERGGFEGFDLSGLWMTVLEPKHEHDGLMYSRWNNLRDWLKRYAKK